MNDEIKEILQRLNKAMTDNNCIDKDIAKRYYDAITNLQKENERLKEEKSLIGGDINNAYSWLRDYKSRVEKAVEYIKGWQSFPHTNCTTHNELKNLLNILQNGSDASVKD